MLRWSATSVSAAGGGDDEGTYTTDGCEPPIPRMSP